MSDGTGQHRRPPRLPSGWATQARERAESWAGVRRRIDHASLRWHARLDSPSADRSLPWILAGGLFVALATLAAARVRGLEPSNSLARYVQAVRQLHDGFGTELTLVPPGVRAPQPLSHLDGSLLLYPLGWLLGFLPVSQTLVLVQSGAIAATVVPLWRLARRVANLRVGAATAVVIAFACYPPIHLMNTAGFDPMVLALPGLAGLIYWALSGNVVRFVGAAVYVITVSAQFGVVLAGFGVLLALTVRRRAGLTLLAIGLVTAVGEQVVPWLGAGDRAFVDGVSFEPGVRSALGALGHGVAHPLASMAHLGEYRVLSLCAALVLPVALLPLMSFRYVAPVLPLQIAYLLGSVPEGQLLGALAVAPTAFLFAATTFALARLGRAGSDRVAVPPRLSGALLGVAALFFLLQAAASPYAAPWQWGKLDSLDGIRRDWTEAVLDRAAADAEAGRAPVVVAATQDMAPLLAGRVPLCALPRERFDCPLEPTLYLVDVGLDARIGQDPDLEPVQPMVGERLLQLRPR